MKVYDADGVLLEDWDPALGRIETERRLVAHHPAIEGVPEKWHHETVRTYPNGGRDVRRVVDSPAIPGHEAWDEYEEVGIFVPFTDEELASFEAQREAEEAAAEAAAEREEFLAEAPSRMSFLEESQLDQDETITALFETCEEMQMATDEAVTALYEMMEA